MNNVSNECNNKKDLKKNFTAKEKRKLRENTNTNIFLHERLASFINVASKYLTSKQIDNFKTLQDHLLNFMNLPEIHNIIKVNSDQSLYSGILLVIFEKLNINKITYERIMKDVGIFKYGIRITQIKSNKYYKVLKNAFN